MFVYFLASPGQAMFFSDIVYSLDAPAAGFNKVKLEKVSEEVSALLATADVRSCGHH